MSGAVVGAHPLVLSRWQRQIIAAQLEVDPDEIERIINGPQWAEQLRRNGPCDCSKIPWPSHKHHYVLTSWGLR